jgi:hypothetical protein
VADGICNNCGASLAGAYCHRCGQKEADTDWRSMGAIGRQFWDELVSLDYKTVRTVLALFRPGRLAAEFIAGRRSRYLTPLKTYLLAAALFFLIAPRVTDFTFERQMKVDREGVFRAMVEKRLADTGVSRELFAERFGRSLQTVYTLMPILSVIALTALLRLFFGRAFPWLGPHMVVALYHVAFLYVVALLLHGLNDRFAPHLLLLLAVQYAILLPYMFAALRRIYSEPRQPTLAKTVAILLLAFVIDSPISIAAVWLSVKLS